MEQNWFEVWENEPGVHVLSEPFHVEEVRSYLVTGEDRAVLIDSGMGVGDIRAVVEGITSLPVTLINSHAHWDHVGGNWMFDDIWIHEAEARDFERTRTPSELKKWFTPNHLTGRLPELVTPETIEIEASRATTLLRGGESIDLGGRSLDIIHTPGHSPGGIVLIDRAVGILFSTDVVYLGPLYAYLPASNVADYCDSLIRMEGLLPEVRTAYPSHGQTPIDPGVIHEMRIAMETIASGRAPERLTGSFASHEFGSFSVLVEESYRGEAGAS